MRRCGFGKFFYYFRQLIRSKAVEEKAGHDGVVFSRWPPLENIGFHPVYFCRRSRQSRSRTPQHFFAVFDAREFGVGKSGGAGLGKFSVTLADAEDAPAIAQFIEPYG